MTSPAFNYIVRAALTPLEHSHIAAIKSPGGIIHAVLGAFLLEFRQAHFTQGLVLGILFLATLAMSLRVTRFWCRSICPLGALLGAVSRWSVLSRMARNRTGSAPLSTLIIARPGISM